MVELHNGASGEEGRMVDLFCAKVLLDPEHHDMVRERYDKILKASIGDIVSKRKRSGMKPDFIGLADWNIMLETWEEEPHVKRSKTNSENAASNPDGLGSHRHTSGAKSHIQVAHEMAVENGRVPVPLADVVCRTHTQRDGTFIDSRTRAFLTAAEALAAERSQQSNMTDGIISAPSVEQLNAAYIETATTKKGRVYGLGSIQELNDDPKLSAAASTLRKAQVELRLSDVEGDLSGIKKGMQVLLRINGVDPVTYQPLVRESAGSAQSPLSEASQQPNLESPNNQSDHRSITLLSTLLICRLNLFLNILKNIRGFR